MVMRLRHLLPAFALILVLICANGVSSAKPELPGAKDLAAVCQGHAVTFKKFKPFSSAVWASKLWRRDKVKPSTIAAQRKKLKCAAGSGHLKAMQKRWQQDKSQFKKHRRKMVWFATYRSFEYPDGSHWAVPYPIAWCESGGNYFVGPSGAYGLIPPFPQWLAPKVQDEIAYRLYREQGEGPWAPYESGCAYR